MFNIYRSIDQLDKLLNKCKELINTENTNSEIINKCFKLLKIIILESEKNKRIVCYLGKMGRIIT